MAKKAKARAAKGHVPLKVLEKRLVHLNNIVTRRNGKSYAGKPTK